MQSSRHTLGHVVRETLYFLNESPSLYSEQLFYLTISFRGALVVDANRPRKPLSRSVSAKVVRILRRAAWPRDRRRFEARRKLTDERFASFELRRRTGARQTLRRMNFISIRILTQTYTNRTQTFQFLISVSRHVRGTSRTTHDRDQQTNRNHVTLDQLPRDSSYGPSITDPLPFTRKHTHTNEHTRTLHTHKHIHTPTLIIRFSATVKHS